MPTSVKITSRLLAVLFCIATLPLIAGNQTADAEKNYLQATSDAMATMMHGMEVTPSGDVDKDFVEGMTAHHQGAIDMAQAMLRYGSDPRLKRIAQEIIITQEQEKVAMRRALSNLPGGAPPSGSP